MRHLHTASLLALFGVAFAAACGSDKTQAADPTDTTPVADASPNTPCIKATMADLTAAGFAASPNVADPNACSNKMYAKYGDAGFQAVNNNIAKLALAAPASKLGSSFQTKIAQASKDRQTQFAEHLLLFLETAYGRTDKTYDGPGMVPAHAGLAITIAQYQYFINDVVVPALKTAGVAPEDISACFAPVVLDAGFVATTVTCK